MKAMRLVAVLVVLAIFCGSSVDALSASETTALSSLAAAWSVDGWSGSPSCTWPHLVCDRNGNVLQLDVSNLGLTGVVPASISGLNNTSLLRLDRNSFSGALPSSIVDIKVLEVFIASHNDLSGEIPSWLANMGVLQYLDLSFNRLNGTLPSFLATLPLDDLYLQNNDLTGTVPAFICHAFEYNLANNRLACPLPTCALCAAKFCAPCYNGTAENA